MKDDLELDIGIEVVFRATLSERNQMVKAFQIQYTKHYLQSFLYPVFLKNMYDIRKRVWFHQYSLPDPVMGKNEIYQYKLESFPDFC
jgi:hypothetical protein